MSQAQINRRAEIDSLGPWFHNLHLPDGTQTAPGHRFGDFPSFKWEKLEDTVPQDMKGWSVLDIGCNAGFYSLQLAQRGAHVLGLEIEPLYLRQAQWIAREYELTDQLEFVEGDVYQLINSQRKFDLVWFTGVFYHLRYPALALDLVRRATARYMMFQSMTMPGSSTANVPDDLPLDGRRAMLDESWPKMSFIERRVAGDESNWWAPNATCVEAMLRSSGFEVMARPEHEFYWCKAVPVPKPSTGDLQRLLGLTRSRSTPI